MLDELATIRLQIAIVRTLVDEVERESTIPGVRTTAEELANELFQLALDVRERAASLHPPADTVRHDEGDLDRVA